MNPDVKAGVPERHRSLHHVSRPGRLGAQSPVRFDPIGLSFFITCANTASEYRRVQVTRWP